MLSIDEVKNIAALARIGLREQEIEKYQKDLSGILDMFKKLQELDTENIEPISHITGMTNRAREDRSEDFGAFGKDAIINNFPDKKDRSVRVKSVF